MAVACHSKGVLALYTQQHSDTIFLIRDDGFVWIIGRVGTAETAAANVLINIMLVAILPGIAFGMSAATVAGQALGRRAQDDAYQWGWDVSKVAICLMSTIGLVMAVFPHFILSVFIHEASTIALANPVQIFGATIFVDGIGVVFQHGLMGVSAAKTSMKVVIGLQWGLFCRRRISLVQCLVSVFGDLDYACRLSSVPGFIFALIWRRRNWMAISV